MNAIFKMNSKKRNADALEERGKCSPLSYALIVNIVVWPIGGEAITIFFATVVVSITSVVGGGIVVGGCDAVNAKIEEKNLSNLRIWMNVIC